MSVRPEDAADVSKGGRPWWLEPAIAAGTTIAGSVLQYKLSKKSADTAHQREVADLSKAGLNPLLSVMGGRGAAVPDVPDFGESVGKGVSNALAVAQMRANVSLTREQAEKTRVERGILQTTGATQQATQSFEIDRAKIARDLADLDFRQRSALFDTAVAKAKADLKVSENSAASLKARADLDRLAAVGAKNVAELEKKLGAGSPAALLVLKYLQVLLQAR